MSTKKVKLLLPIAGLSSRYPDMKPKWMLTHPFGDIMLIQAIKGIDLSNISTIHVSLLKQHDELYNASDGIKKAFLNIGLGNRLRICVLDEPTKSQPETVMETIKRQKIDGPIFIKDSDNYFDQIITAGNVVSIYNLEDMGMVNAANKSYVSIAPHTGMINNIVEKRIISPYFCCGGYGFDDSNQYIEYYNKVSSQDGLYISHIIYNMLLDDISFHVKHAQNYVDWGTFEDWEQYTSKFGTIFIDLDGVLVENSRQFFEPCWGNTGAIKENVDKINELYYSKKYMIIITTSRPYSIEDVTIKQLNKLGIKYHKLICELPHAKRYLINDFAQSNPYPSSISINIPRNGAIDDVLPR